MQNPFVLAEHITLYASYLLQMHELMPASAAGRRYLPAASTAQQHIFHEIEPLSHPKQASPRYQQAIAAVDQAGLVHH